MCYEKRALGAKLRLLAYLNPNWSVVEIRPSKDSSWDRGV